MIKLSAPPQQPVRQDTRRFTIINSSSVERYLFGILVNCFVWRRQNSLNFFCLLWLSRITFLMPAPEDSDLVSMAKDDSQRRLTRHHIFGIFSKENELVINRVNGLGVVSQLKTHVQNSLNSAWSVMDILSFINFQAKLASLKWLVGDIEL